MDNSSFPARAGSVRSVPPSSWIQRFPPLLQPLQRFFAAYLGVDITTFATLFFAWGYLSSAARRTWSSIYDLLLKWFISTVSIPAHDRLSREVMQWLSAKIIPHQGTRYLTAMSTRNQMDFEYVAPNRVAARYRRAEFDDTTPPVRYYPALGNNWFFYERRLFLLQRDGAGRKMVDSPVSEPLVLMCLGRSPEPIKRFLQACKDFAADEKKGFTSIHSAGEVYGASGWSQTTLRPSRPLETVELPEQVKTDLVRDIQEFLHPSARRFYARRGIPYRRGYLFHGPPGTGKTSLSLALAGHMNLELYIISLASGMSEKDLLKLFADLPPKCLVLLEDIDSAGLKRGADDDENETTTTTTTRAHPSLPKHLSSSRTMHPPKNISFSGLLNAIDGVSSQEGRILIMTSNAPEALDSALVRPGRVDMQIHFGPVTQTNAAHIFARMYTKEPEDDADPAGAGGTAAAASPETAAPLATADAEADAQADAEGLEKLAALFASRIPEGRMTPAEVQGFLLTHRQSPFAAVGEVRAWVERVLAAKQADSAIVPP